ncbi:hypothetical protein L198_02665 [Cryptococcus wingfieldii CBS 7118]|uniref:Uncharacterized protein n=1 Tax=Cryptococcus wingfieldii CBS 7118 TaxID=1295528 RepID=A0A1E3JM47_9TREE|nr:hypothetical protein L198_02665 [Cryptococcus wingfieldii CBS 7118]ODO01935.1 hypothetical protein L198_02665 [Cryptococcus wingfieldii CBS 7118]
MNSYSNWHSQASLTNSQPPQSEQPSGHHARPVRSTTLDSHTVFDREDTPTPRPLLQHELPEFYTLAGPPPPPTLPSIPMHETSHPCLNEGALKDTVSSIVERFRYDEPNVAKDESTQALISDIATAVSNQCESLFDAMLAPPRPPVIFPAGDAAFRPLPPLPGFPPNTQPQSSTTGRDSRRGGVAPSEVGVFFSMDDDGASLYSSMSDLDHREDQITVIYNDDSGRPMTKIFETRVQPDGHSRQNQSPAHSSHHIQQQSRDGATFGREGREQSIVQPERRKDVRPNRSGQDWSAKSFNSSDTSPANTRVRFSDPFILTPTTSTIWHQSRSSPVSRETENRKAVSDIVLLRESLSQTDDQVASIRSQISALIESVKALDSKLTDRSTRERAVDNWTAQRTTDGLGPLQHSRGDRASDAYTLMPEDYF